MMLMIAISVISVNINWGSYDQTTQNISLYLPDVTFTCPTQVYYSY